MSNCSFGMAEVEYLGHIVRREGVKVDPKKIQAMQEWPQPKTLKSLRGFLGLTRYYRKFVRNYGRIAKPLTQLLKKNSFFWNAEAQQAFTALKNAMSSTPVLALPDFTKSFVIECDASGTVDTWRPYLLGRHFQIRTDHHSLKYFLEQRLSSPQRNKWLAKMLGYDYEIIYKKGKDNRVADALSRQFEEESTMLAISLPIPEWIEEARRECFHTPGSPNSFLNCRQIQIPSRAIRGRMIFFATRTESSYHQHPPSKVAFWQNCTHLPLQDIRAFRRRLPKSGNKSVIMVVVDRLPKYAHFCALPHPFTPTLVAQSFIYEIFKLHSMPTSIVSDRDPVFTSNFWQELFRIQGTQLKLSTSYHPQTDGQTEAVNKCLETYLRCFTSEKQHLWVQWLPLAEWWYNTNYHCHHQNDSL
eukprot:PITA_07046